MPKGLQNQRKQRNNKVIQYQLILSPILGKFAPRNSFKALQFNLSFSAIREFFTD